MTLNVGVGVSSLLVQSFCETASPDNAHVFVTPRFDKVSALTASQPDSHWIAEKALEKNEITVV